MTDAMSITLGVAAAALPTITVLVGILLNRNDANRLDSRITALEISLRGEISSLQSSLRGEIAAARQQFHSDVLMLLGSDKEQDRRITQLETRS